MSSECEECNEKGAEIEGLYEELKRLQVQIAALRQACSAIDGLSRAEMALELVSLRAIVARVKEPEEELKRLREALEAARDHLDYCGYGDEWERGCARDSYLEEQIAWALGKMSDAEYRRVKGKTNKKVCHE